MKKNLLYIPLDYNRQASDNSVFGSIIDGFNTEFNTSIFTNIDEALLFKPDIILVNGNAITPEECLLLKTATCAFFTVWVGDVRYAPLSEAMNKIDIADLYLFPFNGDHLKSFSKILNTPCEFAFEHFDDMVVREVKELYSGKVVFVGNTYDHFPGGDERISIAKFIGKYVPELEMYGSFPPIDNITRGQIDFSEVPDLYNNSYLTIAHNNRSDIDGYFTHRNLIALASGSCVLMKHFPGIEQFFTNWEHCVFYKTNYELLDIIEFLKREPSIRNKIAKNGNSYVRQHYLNSNFAHNLYQILKNKKII